MQQYIQPPSMCNFTYFTSQTSFRMIKTPYIAPWDPSCILQSFHEDHPWSSFFHSKTLGPVQCSFLTKREEVTGFHIVGGHGSTPHPTNFFWTLPPPSPIKTDALPHEMPPPLKNEAPHLKNKLSIETWTSLPWNDP